MKLIDDIERMIAAKPEYVRLKARDAQRLIDWARRTADKRRNMDTKKLRCAMYRQAQALRAAADKLDAARGE